MRLALLLLAVCLAVAVEVPATVKHVTDGDTIAVTLADGAELKVRLLYVDTPESKDNAHGAAKPEGKTAAEFLRKEPPAGSRIELWGPKATLQRDRYDRALAVIWKHKDMYVGAAGSAAQHVQATRNINLAIVRAGWSPYWRKYGKAPDAQLDKAMTDAQDEAKEAKAGAWATDPQYMTDKANETTAPMVKD